MIANDNSRVVIKLETSLNDNDGVIIYDCHIFIVQITDGGTCHIQKQTCSVEYTFFQFEVKRSSLNGVRGAN
jgi:phosphoribosyl-AMP cyclohydrolase